ncbi:FeoA family protein [Bacteriovorax sp. PP10]|uniref:FeoA family protein n=1 Tax=Bacteriovorax antarcticus TaxID=3088717 RepID=A0ABU5VUW0_9BACT|nr:FeoA family protein [Bacteriovorax sp. PP10]MEA9356824.1 FeoA family protein [Bacteriovorax sp. PP10]
MSLTLADIEVGTKVEVVSYEGEGLYEFKFISLGILPGDQVIVQSKSLFGGPIAIKHGEWSFFALRKEYAKKIIVKRLGL